MTRRLVVDWGFVGIGPQGPIRDRAVEEVGEDITPEMVTEAIRTESPIMLKALKPNMSEGITGAYLIISTKGARFAILQELSDLTLVQGNLPEKVKADLRLQ